MTSPALHAPPPAPRRGPAGPSGSDILDEGLALVTMPVVGLTICPGFLLCVPGLVLALAPMLALGLLAAVAALLGGVVLATALLGRTVARIVLHALTREWRAVVVHPARIAS